MKLLPTQVEDAAWLSSQARAALFHEMGTGKTHTALEAVRLLEFDAFPLLIIAPPISLGMWADEVKKWLDPSLGVVRVKTAKDNLWGADVVVVSHALIASMPDLALDGEPWSTIIVDEAHAMKTMGSSRTKALYGGGARMQRGVAKDADRIWILTGTPITRWPDDLYPHFRALWPELIQSRDTMAGRHPMTLAQFQERYCDEDYDGENTRIVGSRNEPELRGLLDKVSRRRTLKEVMPDMPALVIDQEDLDIPPGAVEAALAICPDLLEWVARYEAGEISAVKLVDVLDTLDGEHLATARRKLGSLKIRRAVERIADDIVEQESDPVLIFGWHPSVVKAMADGLAKIDVGPPQFRGYLETAHIVGGTPQHERERIMRGFNDGQYHALAGNMQALGVSANLQALCSRVFIIEPDWSWANVVQAIKRVHRIGQTRPCRATFLTTPGTTDDAVVSVATDKLRTMTLLGV